MNIKEFNTHILQNPNATNEKISEGVYEVTYNDGSKQTIEVDLSDEANSGDADTAEIDEIDEVEETDVNSGTVLDTGTNLEGGEDPENEDKISRENKKAIIKQILEGTLPKEASDSIEFDEGELDLLIEEVRAENPELVKPEEEDDKE